MLAPHGMVLLLELPELLSPEPGTMIWTAVTFVVLLIVLGKFAWRPLLDALEKREKSIQNALESAAALKAEAEKLLRRAREQLQGQHPLDADAACLLGKILQEKGDLPAAIALYQTVLTTFADSGAAPTARYGGGISTWRSRCMKNGRTCF